MNVPNRKRLIKVVLPPILVTCGMLIVLAAACPFASWVLFSDVKSAQGILCGKTLMVDYECVGLESGWTQVDLEFRNLSLSQNRLQGIELNCDVQLADQLPIQLPPLARRKIPVLVSRSQRNLAQPVVFFVDGERLAVQITYPMSSILPAPRLAGLQRVPLANKGLSSILED